MSSPLDAVSSIKVKLGALVAASVGVASLVALVGSAAGVPALLVLPVTVALGLAVTQLLAAGMVAPLRQMTEVARAMARGDYTGRVATQSTDEVGLLAAAFNQMARDLATVDRERRDLIATVSHELRTPLTAMTALLENLSDGVVPADGQHLGQALVQAERLGDLVADLLALSRLEAGVQNLDLHELPLRELVEDCLGQAGAAGGGGTYEDRVPDGLVVRADPARLRQLVVNAVDNAGRHSPADRPVRITAGSDSSRWWLEITDAGPGIAAPDRERVFERFGTDAVGGGTGLGLAVARWVAQLHGGTLRFVDPPTGVGAVLRLDVPLTPSTPVRTPAELQEVVVSPERQSPDLQAPDAPATEPPRVGGLDSLFGRYWPGGTSRAPGHGLRTVVAAAVVGLLAGVAMSLTEPGLSWTLILVAAGAAALATARHRGHPWTLGCAVLALLLVLPLTIRDAWWIGMLGLLAAAAVFISGVTGARTVTGMVLSGISWPLASLRGLPWFGRSLRVAHLGARAPAVVRTILWSALGLGVFGAIFASADALFASWLDQLVPNLTFGTAVGRAFVACGVFALTLAACYLALNPPEVEIAGERPPTPLRNRFEWLAPVLVVDVVFLGFLVAQATAFFGGHDYVERTTGLTYADYVHEGFGQLTLATALTLLVVWAASRRAGTGPRDRWWLRLALGLLCLQSLVVVGSALHRMHVYQEAYGFTTLRLAVDVFEGWLGVVVLCVMVLGTAGRGAWVPRTALVSGAIALLGLAAVNPEAWVAGRNIDRYEATGRLDLDYLQTLSADATPVIVERLPAEVAGCVLQLLPYNSMREEVLDDPRAWNLGRARAQDALSGSTLQPFPTTSNDPCAPVWSQFADDSASGVG